jgi:hypothetical protein
MEEKRDAEGKEELMVHVQAHEASCVRGMTEFNRVLIGWPAVAFLNLVFHSECTLLSSVRFEHSDSYKREEFVRVYVC